MNPKHVNPGKWNGTVNVLVDYEWFSICEGEYEGKYSIGCRHNGDTDELGYPIAAGHPVWFVLPNEYGLAILQKAAVEILANYDDPDTESLKRVAAAIKKLERLLALE